MRSFIVCSLAFWALILFAAQISPVQAQTAEDLPLLKAQSIASILSSLPTATQIKTLQSNLQADGSFSDIDYSSQERASWPVATHMQRVQFMAEVYTANTSTYYQNSQMKSNFSKAYDYWFSGAFVNTNPNWYANQITIPTYAGRACLLMRAEITATQLNNCRALGAKANWTEFTGQNVVWQAEARLYFALMDNDFNLALACINAIKSVLVIAPGSEEGIKVEGSFLQHGPLLYNGGYGTALTSDIIGSVVPTIRGTAFDFSGISLDALATVFLEGHQWMINTFGSVNTWHIIPLGREITRYGTVRSNMPPIGSVRLVTGARSAEFNAFADRFQKINSVAPLSGNRAYWTSDYVVHNRATYSVGVKMYSRRTYNAECVNLEGKKSLKLSDGSMFVYTGGEEYVNIFGGMDWEKIPGITSEVGSIPFICGSKNNIKITNSPIEFAGTVSDGTYGVTGYAYLPPPSPAYNSTLVFKKSWFYFDDEIVVLTSGVSTNSSYDVITTLDQRRVNGPIYTSGSVSTPLVRGTHDLTGDWWVHHDNVGYILPEVKNGANLKLFVENVNKTGNWQDINNIVTVVDENEFFTAWIQGQSPNANQDAHQVIIIPGTSFEAFPSKRDSALNNINVLSNTPQVQAVHHKALNILSATFYSPASVSFEAFTLTTDTPCLVMAVFKSDGSVDVSVSDPTQSVADVTLTVTTVFNCDACTDDGRVTTLRVTLPTGDYTGSTATHTLLNPSAPSSRPGQSPSGSVSAANLKHHALELLVLLLALVQF